LTILPAENNERIIINLINRPKRLFRLNQLGLQTADLRDLKKILKLRSGLIIISSPPGGGKSATLYSLLNALKPPELNIYLLSASELDLPGINQIKPSALNWEKINNHDSDIIGVDDLNEDWVLTNAFKAAAAGRLVLGTMTAENVQEVQTKINQIKLPVKLKMASLRIIINQRLAKLKRPQPKSKDKRTEIGLFEILKLSPDTGFKPLELIASKK